MPLGERKRRAAGTLRILARGASGIAAGDVEIDDVAAEQLVADGPADDPGLLAGKDLARELIASSTTRLARAGLESMPQTSS